MHMICFGMFMTHSVHDGSIIVFNGDKLWRITDAGLEYGYPVATRDIYPYAPSAVDAAVYSRKTFYTYLFYGYI